MSISVKVTRDDISRGTSCNKGMCAIDIAVKREFKADYVVTGLTMLSVTKDEVKTYYKFDSSVSRWICDFEAAARYGKKDTISPIVVDLTPLERK